MASTTETRDQVLSLFQALGEETRLRIVELLTGGERCVCELQDELGAAQSRLSFHLKKLKDAGLVADRREGRWVYYALDQHALEAIRAFLGAVQPAHEWSRQASLGEVEPAQAGGTQGTGCCS